ncbi:class I SAM-dependent methyltransferase [Longimicrobium terrae]|uniref:SAM-dependent methyltransferase n=1 Tax=Longimicrobium terrae TaxID=1639882 RepID=A0A841H071_9BACT|nr:class I SAM-dependent methyltransferase [Longimicrobium terrae]MBB4636972.1 SAM-dependent methyltransferase [Longimicrobium terrae]MBB6071420.1 SAM-dependent methyltransferase [Longimicrobium terrae]NNC31359.1 class I SAM-dependent methyltransferase [Longimicrobium terrae]
MPALYDQIGHGYDTTRRADPFLVSRIVNALGETKGGPCLDLACGSGNYTLALAGHGIRIHGTDQSRTMIASAAKKAGRGAPVTWSVADATALPFATGAFGGAVCTLALHHFPALAPPFAEVRRTLAGGRFVLFTATREQMAAYWLREYFPVALERSASAMPAEDEIVKPLRAAGFGDVRLEPYEVAPDLQDLFLYSGKHRPHMYLDANVRANMSTFGALADPAEVAAGCARLAADLSSGRIDEVIAAYPSRGGDYLLVAAGD